MSQAPIFKPTRMCQNLYIPTLSDKKMTVHWENFVKTAGLISKLYYQRSPK